MSKVNRGNEFHLRLGEIARYFVWERYIKAFLPFASFERRRDLSHEVLVGTWQLAAGQGLRGEGKAQSWWGLACGRGASKHDIQADGLCLEQWQTFVLPSPQWDSCLLFLPGCRGWTYAYGEPGSTDSGVEKQVQGVGRGGILNTLFGVNPGGRTVAQIPPPVLEKQDFVLTSVKSCLPKS